MISNQKKALFLVSFFNLIVNNFLKGGEKICIQFSNNVDLKTIKYIKIINYCTDVHRPLKTPIEEDKLCCFTSSIDIVKEKQIFNNLEGQIIIKFLDGTLIKSEHKFVFIIDNFDQSIFCDFNPLMSFINRQKRRIWTDKGLIS